MDGEAIEAMALDMRERVILAIMHEAQVNGADSPVDRGDAEQIADAIIAAITAGREEIVRETVEKCAKVADEFPEEMLFMWERPGGPPGNGYGPSKPKHVAIAIRALAPPPIARADETEAGVEIVATANGFVARPAPPSTSIPDTDEVGA